MGPERRRRTVESVRRALGQEKTSERRVWRVLGQNRGTQRHRPRKVDGDRKLLEVMRKIVETFPRYGSDRVHRVLTGPDAFGGWRVNFKRVHRIWKEERMQVPRKQRKCRGLPGGSANGCVRHRAMHRNHVWSYDFLTERTEDGRQLRILVVIDEFTRECPAIDVARSFTVRDVIMTLQYLFSVRGAPEHLRSDNGPVFVAKEIQAWLARACVRTLYTQKASPWENGYVESFNGRRRDELLAEDDLADLMRADTIATATRAGACLPSARLRSPRSGTHRRFTERMLHELAAVATSCGANRTTGTPHRDGPPGCGVGCLPDGRPARLSVSPPARRA
jgi:putative transposase